MRYLFRISLFAAVSLPASLCAQTQPPDDLTNEVAQLRALVIQLQGRVQDLEARLPAAPAPPVQTAAATAQVPADQSLPSANPSSQAAIPSWPTGTTFNVLIDTYYGYNFNNPIGRYNLLRAYDVLSNAISLNQAAVVIENAPDAANGKRYGARLDLQWGQATETLQGNPANEPRPEIYRNIFQAYGTYVFPVSRGLTVDLGKWASSLGIEGNYTKDQLNYSRSYWFDFLPFYHMGVRANYKLSDAVGFNYWLVNGTQQTEPYNGFKDEMFGLNLQPHKSVNVTINYYLGQEHPDVIYYPNGVPATVPPDLPEIQGTPFQPITNAPNGKLHIFDSYVSWQPSTNLTLALEGDYLIQRLLRTSSPSHTDGGAVYASYQFSPRVAFAGRAEYLSDRGGLFTGANQALKETTLTARYKMGDGLMALGEWRRDFSNNAYFLTDTLGRIKKEQNTATLGLIFWWGSKQGLW